PQDDTLSPDDLVSTPISEMASHIARGDVAATALLDACVARIERYEPALNAFITRTLDLARQQAEACDREARAGRVRGSLHGIPIVVKDAFDLAGFPTTAGSRILRESIAAANATAVDRLINAGAVVLG